MRSLISLAWILLLALARPTPAAVVINEIHYAPDVKTERVEFIELYNPDSSAVELTGCSLAGGVQFTFPSGATLAPGGYLVVAENPAALRQKFGFGNALGPWTGRLSNQGERLVVRSADGQVLDEVEYALGFPWPTVGDAPGYSIELINPGLDNNLGGSWRASVVGNPGVHAKTILPEQSTWTYFKGTSEASDPSSAWRTLDFDDSGWPQGETPVGYGENFIRTPLEDMRGNYTAVFLRKVFQVDDPALISTLLLEAQYDDGIKIWINGVNVVNANISPGDVPVTGTANSALENAAFVPFPLSSPASFLVAGANVIAVQAHNSSLTASSDFFFDLRLTAQIGPSGRGPTPGARNCVYAENAPPQVRQVRHEPQQPASGQPVTIRAKVTDPDGVATVRLEYQVVEPGHYIELADPEYQTSWTSVQMKDDGSGGDAISGDDVFTVQLPPELQIHRRLVRYRIQATDQGGREVLAPYPDDPQPNFGYFVYGGVPEWSGAIQPDSFDPARSTPIRCGTDVMRRVPAYHLLAKKADVEQATWLERYGGDQYKWKGTLVYDGQVYDHIGFRARGGVWRYAMGKNMWKFDFHRGHDFQARDNYGRRYGVAWTKLNLGACIQQGDYLHRGEQGMFESVGLRLFNLAGVEAPKTHFVQFRIVDEEAESDPNDQYSGDFWGLYMAVEQEDGRFLDEHNLPDGNFYKMEDGTGELNNQGATGATDKSDLNTFMATYQSGSPSESWWRTHFRLEAYFSYQAIVQGIHHYDICYGKNYFYYLHPETGLWSVHPWDLDLTWADNMFDPGCGGMDDFKRVGLLNRPAFKMEWQNRIREIRDLLFNTDQTWQLIDEFAAMIHDPNGGPSFVDADRARWDYNPIMAESSLVILSKAGRGLFYGAAPTRDFPGMLQIMKDYVITRSAFLDNLSRDSLIPDQPVIEARSSAGFPVNRLAFQAAPYSGANPFAALQWRIGEVSSTNGPALEPKSPRHYEIETVWQSPLITSFAPDMTVPAEALKVGHLYRVRVRMEDNTGRWSHWSDPVEFVAGPQDNAAALQEHLRLTELMGNPPAGSDFEFIEMVNTSSSLTLDLAGVKFTQGIDYTFPAGATLGPGAYLLVVSSAATDNFAGFRAHYALGPGLPIFGPYQGALNNNGEQITLKTAANGSEILAFQYGNGTAWPAAANGAGHSLVPVESALSSEGIGSLNYSGNWRASTFLNGSPGRPDPVPPPGPVLNEIVAHTDFLSAEDSNDWIELFNPTDSSIQFGPGWYLSDDASQLRKWQIPLATTLPAHSWVVFDEVTGFHNPPATGFGLNKDGEQVFLSWLLGTNTDRVVDSVAFKAQENDWSLGRSPDGSRYWSALTPRTRGSANSAPPLRVVISEIMFNSKADPLKPGDHAIDEFLEVFNATSLPVNLFNTNGAWRLDGGVKFSIPPNTTLPPGGRLLLVNFDPASVSYLRAFRAAYNWPDSDVPVLGPYDGNLNDSSERVALEKPQAADVPDSPPAWVVVDEVIFADQSPWPESADGTRLSLQRVLLTGPGDDPTNWVVAAPTPGRVEVSADRDTDGLPDAWELAHGLDPASPSDAGLDPDADGLTNLQEFQAGTDPNDHASVLRLSWASGAGGTVVLQFQAMAAKTYTLWWSDSLKNGSWQILQTVPATNLTRTVQLSDPGPGTSGQRYYRVGVGL